MMNRTECFAAPDNTADKIQLEQNNLLTSPPYHS